jgi:hypothetical protein
MTAVEHIRDDATLTDKEKGERIIPALQAFFVGNSAVVRKELSAKLEAIPEIRDCVSARERGNQDDRSSQRSAGVTSESADRVGESFHGARWRQDRTVLGASNRIRLI